MRTGIFLSYAGGFREAADQVVELEKGGVDIALVAEAYSYDAISQLGYLAAKTSTIELGSGVVPIYTRTPTLLAMTAAGLDYVSDGRFRLGIGTSGPQVIEGFHGVPFDAPLGRTREVVEICRQVWRRETVHLRRQALPDPAARRAGHRARQAAEADQSPCARTHPDHHRRARPEERRADRRDRRGLAAGVLLPGEGRRRVGRRAAGRVRQARPGAGPAGRHGQRAAWPSATTSRTDWPGRNRNWRCTSAAWARGARTSTTTWPPATASARSPTTSRTCTWQARRPRPSRRCPTSWCAHVSLVGPRGFVKERLAAFAEAGVTTLLVHPLSGDRREPVRFVEELVTLAS